MVKVRKGNQSRGVTPWGRVLAVNFSVQVRLSLFPMYLKVSKNTPLPPNPKQYSYFYLLLLLFSH